MYCRYNLSKDIKHDYFLLCSGTRLLLSCCRSPSKSARVLHFAPHMNACILIWFLFHFSPLHPQAFSSAEELESCGGNKNTSFSTSAAHQVVVCEVKKKDSDVLWFIRDLNFYRPTYLLFNRDQCLKNLERRYLVKLNIFSAFNTLITLKIIVSLQHHIHKCFIVFIATFNI